MSKIAIITGASSGIGAEFVRQIASKKEIDEFWLIARREERLSQTAGEIDIKCKILPLDLTKKASLDFIKESLEENIPNIKYLVNASGFGKFGEFDEVKLADNEDMIELNTKALVSLTYLCLPYMTKGAQIIFMGSLSSYLPLPNFSVYAASKAFVLSFSYALHRELKSKGIKVTALCPGWVNTEFAEVADNSPYVHGPKKLKPMAKAKDVVKLGLKDAGKNKTVSVYGFTNKAVRFFTKFLPRTTAVSAWMKMQKRN